jgi:hypothetical protein
MDQQLVFYNKFNLYRSRLNESKNSSAAKWVRKRFAIMSKLYNSNSKPSDLTMCKLQVMYKLLKGWTRSYFQGAQCAEIIRDRSGGDRISWRRNVARDAILYHGVWNREQEGSCMEVTPPEYQPGSAWARARARIKTPDLCHKANLNNGR